MDLKLIYYREGERSVEYWHDTELHDAKDIVTGWVERGDADEVILTDDEDRILYKWPRTLRPA